MTESNPACLYCQRASDQIPLIQLEYKNERHWICPQHLPILIHRPAELAEFLPGIEKLEDFDHGGS
jgi:hypothetical protein